MPRGEEKYEDSEKQLISWLAKMNGEGSRKDFIDSSGIRANSLTDIQRRLKRKGLVEIDVRDRKQFYRLTSKGHEYAIGVDAQSISERYNFPEYVANYLERVRSKRVTKFWLLQEKYAEEHFGKRENLVVCGPPASGKTLIAEIEMLWELNQQNRGKAIYCTPFKALDRQKHKDFVASFGALGFEVVATDGDHPSTEQSLGRADIIVATYERILMALRNDDHWLNKVSLVCADEITVLDELDRGSNLDLVLTMFKKNYDARIIVLSSLIGNPDKIASWLDAKLIKEGRNVSEVEEQVAYIKDNEIIYLNADHLEKKEKLEDGEDIFTHIISQNLGREQTTLIFLPSRLHTKMFAERLTTATRKHLSDEELAILSRSADDIVLAVEENTPLITELAQNLRGGIAFHHAGLPFEARKMVEDLLEKRHLKTICCTTTLSHGIDYPVDNVIIAFFLVDSKTWEVDRYSYTKQYSYVQLKGRSGRPDKSKGRGHVFLLAPTETDAENLWHRYIYKATLEDIRPRTLTKENVAKVVLCEAKAMEGAGIQKIASIIRATLDFRFRNIRDEVLLRAISSVIADLKSFGLVDYRQDKIVNTDLGNAVNHLTQSPYDAYLMLQAINEGENITDLNLLFVASSTGLAKDVRAFSLTTREKENARQYADDLRIDLNQRSVGASLRRALILSDYIEEVDVGSMTQKFDYFDDNDIYDLSRYASRSMYEIAKIATDTGHRRMAKRALKMARRIAFGVKEDLLSSGLILIPGIGRRRGRRLMEAGFHTTEDVATAPRIRIVDTARVSSQTASEIQDAARRICTEGLAKEDSQYDSLNYQLLFRKIPK